MRIRTGYSFRTAVGHLPEVIDHLKSIKCKVAPITDRNSTFGFSIWSNLAKKADLRPIFGVELGVVTNIGEKRPSPNWWTFYAVNSLRPLHELVARASERNMELSINDALSAEDVIGVAGERSKVDELPKGQLIFLSPSLPVGLYKAAKKKGLKFVASSDNVFTTKEDLEFYRVSFGRNSSTQTYPQYILTDKEWSESVSWFAEDKDIKSALKNRDMILKRCKAEIKPAELLVPDKPFTLRELCEQGAKKLGCDLKDPVYSERLDRELKMIDEKKFGDYFHILADIIGWSKKHMIVGPARGSSCGSLVCYLIGITSIDPIPFDLVFERFIDVTRADLPDVDIDFSDKNRHLAFEYAEEKYGRDHVARLGSVTTFQPKSAFKTVASSLWIPGWKVDKVVSSVIKRSQGDSRADSTIEDTLTSTDAGRSLIEEYPEIKIVGRMENHPSGSGQHAAGIVITKLPVTEHVAVDRRTGSTMCDKYDAERLDMLKIDALGLTQLSVFERTLELTGRKPVNGFLESIPLDDQRAFDVLNRQHFSGIFQFVGRAVRSLGQQLLFMGGKFDRFDDFVALTALARPGPMGGGSAEEWIRRRVGYTQVSYVHPAFEPYLKSTYGVPIYQEQILAIGRELGDLSWDDVTKLRKAMSRSMGKEYFDQFGDRWKAGAVKRGIPKEVLDKQWDDMVNFGAWAFNKAHSVAYGTVSYWCCWLKARHPVEFAAATLDVEKDPQNQINTLRELRAEGIDYVSVDPDTSNDRWTKTEREGKTILVGPLTSIKGIGPAGVRDIIEARKTGKKLKVGLQKKLDDARTEIDSLYPIRDISSKLISEAKARREVLEARTDLTDAEVEELKHCIKVSTIQSEPITIEEIYKNDLNDREVMIICIMTRMDQTNENALLRIQKRGGRRVTGPEESVQMFAKDDTGEMFCKINRYDFDRIGREISERGAVGKAIYALKGPLWIKDDFRMLWVKQARYIGDIR